MNGADERARELEGAKDLEELVMVNRVKGFLDIQEGEIKVLVAVAGVIS